MAPSAITEDYYAILEVQQNATSEQITKSYRRLALKLHPDRKAEGDSTRAFQLLGQAYEALIDEGKRRTYDLIYPSINRSKTRPETAQPQTPRPPPNSGPRSEAYNENARIAALRKAKEDRNARWKITKTALEPPIFELQRTIRRLEQEIKNLAGIEAAERAAEASKNSWRTWILSPLYKRIEESEEEKSRKDRESQERRIEKDLKERRLDSHKAELLKKEDQMKEAKESINAENLRNDQSIEVIEARKRYREEQERRQKEREEQERLANIRRAQAEQQARIWKEQQEAQARIWRQQQEQRGKTAQKAREDFLKAQAEDEAAQAARQQPYERLYRKTRNGPQPRFTSNSTRQPYTSACDHGVSWLPDQGMPEMPERHETKVPAPPRKNESKRSSETEVSESLRL